MISGTPVERVSSFKYLGVNISEDLTWTTHIQTQIKKARQKTVPSATAEEIQGLSNNPENFLFWDHRKCIDSVHLSVVWKQLQPRLQGLAESCALSWAYLWVCSPLSAGHLPSNAAEADLSKSPRTQITLETGYSLCCHLVSASAAWWLKLRDLGGVSSPRPSGSWTQTQPLTIIMTSLTNHSQSVIYSHSLLSTSYWQCHLLFRQHHWLYWLL